MDDDFKYRARYEYSREWKCGKHLWVVVGATAGIHLHITDCRDESIDRFSGGIEFHWRSPPPGREQTPPDHDDCFVLKQPCWHDGSSTQSREFWIPYWRAEPNDHDRMLLALGGELKQRVVLD